MAHGRPRLRGADGHHIRHGHFKALRDGPESRLDAKRALSLAVERKAVVFVGQVRPYKGLPEFLDSVTGLDVDVLIAGRCDDPGLRMDLEARALGDNRLRLKLEYLSNHDLWEAIVASDLLVFPYRKIFNSGSAILGLSAGRRILVPSSSTFLELAKEVGSGWVATYEPGECLANAVANVLALSDPESGPILNRYDWQVVADATRDVYLYGESETCNTLASMDGYVAGT